MLHIHCNIFERCACQRWNPSARSDATKDLHATIHISHALTMFVVTEAQAAAIRTAHEQHGEFSAAVELPQLFPGIADNVQARECARTIASWKPLSEPLRRMRLRPAETGCPTLPHCGG